MPPSGLCVVCVGCFFLLVGSPGLSTAATPATSHPQVLGPPERSPLSEVCTKGFGGYTSWLQGRVVGPWPLDFLGWGCVRLIVGLTFGGGAKWWQVSSGRRATAGQIRGPDF